MLVRLNHLKKNKKVLQRASSLRRRRARADSSLQGPLFSCWAVDCGSPRVVGTVMCVTCGDGLCGAARRRQQRARERHVLSRVTRHTGDEEEDGGEAAAHSPPCVASVCDRTCARKTSARGILLSERFLTRETLTASALHALSLTRKREKTRPYLSKRLSLSFFAPGEGEILCFFFS